MWACNSTALIGHKYCSGDRIRWRLLAYKGNAKEWVIELKSKCFSVVRMVDICFQRVSSWGMLLIFRCHRPNITVPFTKLTLNLVSNRFSERSSHLISNVSRLRLDRAVSIFYTHNNGYFGCASQFFNWNRQVLGGPSHSFHVSSQKCSSATTKRHTILYLHGYRTAAVELRTFQ